MIFSVYIYDINNKNIHIINLDKVSKWLKTRKSILKKNFKKFL